jgi:hypothetical protein
MAKIRKELNSIETTGIRKAMKEVPAKVRKGLRLSLTRGGLAILSMQQFPRDFFFLRNSGIVKIFPENSRLF